jgi:hypothetical protein
MMALVEYGMDPIIARGSRLGPRALRERPMTERRATLEREIRRLRESIAASESALKIQVFGARDRAWVTKQLGLRQQRLERLAARIDALGSDPKNQRNPRAGQKLNSSRKGSGQLGEK